jgi:hypothetical protein
MFYSILFAFVDFITVPGRVIPLETTMSMSMSINRKQETGNGSYHEYKVNGREIGKPMRWMKGVS